MTKIETLKNSAKVLFGSDNPTISGEEYLELLESAKSREEKEFFTQIYNYLLAQRQKEVIANERY
jgi:predicted TIM-barrel fold metal-dependent hydrolase